MRVLIVFFIAISCYVLYVTNQQPAFTVVKLTPLNYVVVAKQIISTRKKGGFFQTTENVGGGFFGKASSQAQKGFFGGSGSGFFGSSNINDSIFNRELFFDNVRHSIFSGRMSGTQQFGMEELLIFWEQELPSVDAEFTDSWANKSLEMLAYVLATTYHETAHRMEPINEYGGPSYWQKYQGRASLGNFQPGDGVKFHGRGYTQLTGRKNYRVMSEVLRQFYPDAPNLLDDPDAANDPRYAAVIIFYGMIMGTFTGLSMENYLGNGYADFNNARRVINGTDQSNLIASYAERFNAALEVAQEL
jgi:putative chitinase